MLLYLRRKFMDKILNINDINSYEEDFRSKKCHLLARNAVITNGIYASSINDDVVRSLPDSFSIDIKDGNITDQKQSGRCWMFAGFNALKPVIMKTFLKIFAIIILVIVALLIAIPLILKGKLADKLELPLMPASMPGHGSAFTVST